MAPRSSFSRTCLAVALGQMLSVPAWSAVITVDEAGCTLAEAIANANSNTDGGGNGCATGSGDDVIQFNLSLPAEIIGFNLPTITSTVTINGPGQSQLSIYGMYLFRPFSVSSGTLILSDLTITGGTAEYGGGILAANASVALTNVTVTNCAASMAGGAIHASGSSVSLVNSMMSGNSGRGGGIYAHQSSSVSLLGSTVAANTGGSPWGGGIAIIESSLNVNGSVVTGNTTPGQGGGIFAGGAPSVVLTDSVVSGNSSGSGGGLEIADDTTASLTNVTVSGNTAGGGGAVYIADASISIINSTLSGNSSHGSGGAISADMDARVSLLNTTLTGNTATSSGGGIKAIFADEIKLANSVVSGNSGTTGVEIYGGGFIANQNNLFGHAGLSGSDAFFYFVPGPRDIVATSDGRSVALAGILDTTLADNGGPTQTHALVAGSPAVAGATLSSCPETDQRGEPRGKYRDFFFPVITNDGEISMLELGEFRCDIGAVEFQEDD